MIDIDTWDQEDIQAVLDWAAESPAHHVAISNPKFELFLIMHFEKGNGCTTPALVDAKMSRLMPAFSKRLNERQFTKDQIYTAIENAKSKRQSCQDEIPAPGMTDFYRLVEELLDLI